MGFKDMLGIGSNKGSDCKVDEHGVKQCSVMEKKGNNLLATGSNYSYTMDGKCDVHLSSDSRILEEDEQEVMKQIRRDKSLCKSTGRIN